MQLTNSHRRTTVGIDPHSVQWPPVANPTQSGVAAPAPTFDLLARAVVFEGAEQVGLRELELNAPGPDDLVVDVDWSGVSTGTERLMWSGRMPQFPGMAYPLVPGYEATGRVIAAENHADLIGRTVFAPGARCFVGVNGLFGASASRLVIPAARAVPLEIDLGEQGLLLALAATAHHALAGGSPPDLIVGHGALGRLLARIAIARGDQPPVVWEIAPERADADGYAVIEPDRDGRNDYRSIYDVSGDSNILDSLVAHLAPRGEIVLAGFYWARPSFDFPKAFMKEARLRIAAEWERSDVDAVTSLLKSGRLSFDGLITHRCAPDEIEQAYRTAFSEPACLKMAIDWRGNHGGNA